MDELRRIAPECVDYELDELAVIWSGATPSFGARQNLRC